MKNLAERSEVKFFTTREMRALDLNAPYHGFSILQMMENAGAGVARRIRARFPRGGRVVAFAGTGNNGGDAFVAARRLAPHFEVEVVLVGRARDIAGAEARRNWDLLQDTGALLREARDPRDLRPVEATAIIDGLLGTGSRLPVREPIRSAIRAINRSRGHVVSVDIPSGMDPDTGRGSPMVKADLVVTLHAPKPGLFKHRGEVVVASLGLPPGLDRRAGPGDLQMLGRRTPRSHKGDHGRILIVGGGEFFGAPALAALGALRAGADIVTLAVPRPVADIVSTYTPDFIVRALPGDHISPAHLPRLHQLLGRHDVLCIGMGMGDNPMAHRAAVDLIRHAPRAVVDAEALDPQTRGRRGASIILTPHKGELSRLLGDRAIPEDKRRETAITYARSHGLTVLLKGHPDVITDGTRHRLNTTHHPGMTVGGTGDVLAGVTARLLAEIPDPLWAASGAAFTTGAAGNLAAEEYGNGLTASDVAERVGWVMKRYGV